MKQGRGLEAGEWRKIDEIISSALGCLSKPISTPFSSIHSWQSTWYGTYEILMAGQVLRDAITARDPGQHGPAVGGGVACSGSQGRDQ